MIKKNKFNQIEFERIINYLKSDSSIITNLLRSDCYNDYPKFYQYISEYRNLPYSHNQLQANGISNSKNIAILKAVMETIERWYLYSQSDTFIHTSYDQLLSKTNIINPQIFSSFSSSQLKKPKYKNFIFSNKNKFRWSSVQDLLTHKEYKIPAQLIYFNIHQKYNESIIRIPDSTGAAAAFSLEHALYNAICEIIERDAIAIAYYNKLPMSKINFQTCQSNKINSLLEYLHQYLFDVNVFKITLDIDIPIYMTVLIDTSKNLPVISIGSKCSLDSDEAIYGSILESIQSLTMIRDHVNIQSQFGSDTYNKKIIGDNPMLKRVLKWIGPQSIDNLSYLFLNKEISYTDNFKPITSYKDALNVILTTLQKNNITNIYYKQIEDKNLSAFGIYTVKVLIPELTPLCFIEGIHYWGNTRLFQVPVKAKFIKNAHSTNELNTIPHPFI